VAVGSRRFDEVELRESTAGRARIVSVAGELDLASSPRLSALLDRLCSERAALVLDLTGCTFIDSTGLRTILGADARARRDGRRLVVIPGPPPVHRVFRIALLDQRLDFEEGDALADRGGEGP